MADAVVMILLLMGAAYFTWTVLVDLRRGVLSHNRVATPVRRAEKPVTFWLTVALGVVLALLFLGLGGVKAMRVFGVEFGA